MYYEKYKTQYKRLNIIWFFAEAPNDILRNESITLTIDFIAGVFQIIMVICLCFSNKKYKLNIKGNLSVLINIVLYFLCWILYYCGITFSPIILGLCIFPCLSFLFYEIKIKNWAALIPTVLFSVFHLLYGIINFI